MLLIASILLVACGGNEGTDSDGQDDSEVVGNVDGATDEEAGYIAAKVSEANKKIEEQTMQKFMQL